MMRRQIFYALILFATNFGHSALYAASGGEVQVIKVSAKKFEFTPSVIKVKKGVPVTIELTSEDRKHGFKIKEFNVETTIKHGEPTRVTFTPDKAGVFQFHCSAFCGSGHEDMTGTIEVSE
jgi:cytochrome c oxidase subunit II